MKSKRAVGPSSRNLVVIVTVFVVVIWMVSLFALPFLVPKFSSLADCQSLEEGTEAEIDCSRERLAAYGMFGDAFGAVNSLFSGLALAGVVLTLFLHSEASRRAAKPFIVPRMKQGDSLARVSIKEPKREGGVVHIPMEAVVPFHNSSSHPALNISLRIDMEGVSGTGVCIVEMPLAGNGDSECKLSLDIVGEEAEKFRRAVVGGGVVISIRTDYESVEGVSWYSQVKYRLQTNAQRPADTDLLQHAVDGRMAEVSSWSAETMVDLDFSTVPDSWRFGEA